MLNVEDRNSKSHGTTDTNTLDDTLNEYGMIKEGVQTLAIVKTI